jgi:hypothetical protein
MLLSTARPDSGLLVARSLFELTSDLINSAELLLGDDSDFDGAAKRVVERHFLGSPRFTDLGDALQISGAEQPVPSILEAVRSRDRRRPDFPESNRWADWTPLLEGKANFWPMSFRRYYDYVSAYSHPNQMSLWPYIEVRNPTTSDGKPLMNLSQARGVATIRSRVSKREEPPIKELCLFALLDYVDLCSAVDRILAALLSQPTSQADEC